MAKAKEEQIPMQDQGDPVIVGSSYYVRTDTDHWVGRVISVLGPYTVVIDNFCWVASSGRLGEFLAKGKSANMEIEVAPKTMTNKLHFRSIISWPHPLFTETV